MLSLPGMSLPGTLVSRLLTAALILLSPCAAVTSAQAQSPARLPLQTRTAASVPAAVDAGPVAEAQTMTVALTLTPSAAKQAALDTLLIDLGTASSPSYHQWLTPQQFAASFGADSTQVAAATAWAQAQGLTATLAPSGQRLLITGTAGQMEAAFAVSLHNVQMANSVYFAATATPSVPASAAGLFAAVDGLDNLPGGGFKATYQSAQGPVSGASTSFTALAAAIDQNLTPVLSLDSSSASPASASPAQLIEYQQLFKQTAAQGVTVLATRGSNSGAFPASFAEVTEVALAGDPAETATASFARPAWQVAPGLPDDALRHAPDLEAPSLSALAQTFTTLAAGGRLGNVNATLYTLGPIPGLYTQPDAAAAGTWEPATGLGLVDVAKLGKVYPRGAGMSFVSLSASSYQPVHGQGESFTATVSSGTGGGTPTGTVAFISNGVTLATVAVSNGTATYSTNTLPGGTSTITVMYSGDATYAPATNPSPLQLYVTPEASNLGVQVSGGAVIGTNFTVIVTDSAPSGVGVPTGAVTVTLPVNGATYSGTLVQNGPSSSSTTISVPPPAVGTITLSVNCTATASYSCNNPYTTTVNVSKATPSLTINYSPNPPVSGQSITLNATVSAVGTAPTPTGNVQFFDNGTTLNAGALNSGTTTTVGTVPTSNTHSITATYQGDANYNTVSTTAGSTTSGAISTSLSLSASSSTVVANQNITFTAVLTPSSSGSSQPTGTVQFFDNASTLLGTASVSGNVATLTTATLSAANNHVVTAVYSGDTIYTGSTSPSVTVGKSTVAATTSVLLTASAASYTPGTPINLSAQVLTNNTTNLPTGTVQFFDNGVALGSAAVSSQVAVFSATFTTGTQVITAVYSGDTNNQTSTSSALTLNKSTATTATTTTLTVSPASPAQFTFVQLSAIVAPTVNNTVPTGTVQFFQGNQAVCSATLSGSTASCSIVQTLTGTFSFTADYQGDANYAASVSNAVAATVVAPPATLTATISPMSVQGGGTATINATLVAPTSLVPAGQLTATILGVPGAVFNVTLPGTANTSTVTVQIPVTAPTTAGSYNVVVSCAGTNFTCAPVTVALTDTGGTTAGSKISTLTVLTPSAPSLPANGAETLTATITPASTGTAVPAGTVSFYDGTTLLGTANVAAVGTSYQASVATVLAATTTHSLTAIYSGDANYATSTSTAVTLGSGTTVLTQAAITLTASQTAGLSGSGITFTADVTGLTSTGTSPTGTVTFYLAGTTPAALATVSLQAAGSGLSVATFITSGLPAGNSTVYAVYSGDTNFTTVRSNSVSLGLDSFNVTFVPQSLTLKAGQSGQSTLILGIVNGFAGTVSFGCTPPPNQQMTCSFSPTVLTGGGSTVLTVTTTAPRAQTTERISFGFIGGLLATALLCWMIPARRRLRLPALVMVALALGLMTNAGCSQGGNQIAAAQSGGTPLGTTVFTVTAAGSDGINTVRQNYSFQVTVQ